MSTTPPLRLARLVEVLDDAVLVGATAGDVEVVDAVHDSRSATPGTLFCALRGARTDGHDHAAGAVATGASALLVDHELPLDVPQLVVPDTRAVLGHVAAAVHGHPSRQLRLVGVTGTNGKTTTVGLVEAAAAAAGLGTGVIGTIGARVHGAALPNERTTPEATDLQRMLRRFVDRGVELAAIEVSSHGLALGRVDGCRFAVGGFTMLGEDHLDFHADLEAYLAAKQRLFTTGLSDRAVVVTDDDAGRRVAAASGVPTTTLATDGTAADVTLVDVTLDLEGGSGRLVWHASGVEATLRTRLLGRHNLANAALAVLLAVEAGVPLDAALAGVAACPGVAGRLERVPAGPDAPVVLVDYAHSPDAVRTVVAQLRTLAPSGARLAVVLGAGGDRDTTKRAPMGAAAAAADLVVVTSDNPRSEDPDLIIDAVEAGARAARAAGAPADLVREVDRRAAIATALRWARPGDVVLVAGKGHETGQTFAERTEPFDDRVVAAELLAEVTA